MIFFFTVFFVECKQALQVKPERQKGTKSPKVAVSYRGSVSSRAWMGNPSAFIRRPLRTAFFSFGALPQPGYASSLAGGKIRRVSATNPEPLGGIFEPFIHPSRVCIPEVLDFFVGLTTFFNVFDKR